MPGENGRSHTENAVRPNGPAPLSVLLVVAAFAGIAVAQETAPDTAPHITPNAAPNAAPDTTPGAAPGAAPDTTPNAASDATPDTTPAGFAAEPPPSARPKIALVLSGGGARGAAHIGALRVLEEMRVPVDFVVGTSIGSIIGGLYATGWTPDEMERLLTTIDWNRQVFDDRVVRTAKPFPRRQDDGLALLRTRLRFRGGTPYLPPGVIEGQRLDILLQSIEVASTAETDFDRFPLPYRAVAQDAVTGEAVVIGDGRLGEAMRASMAIPGIFAPVTRDGRTLIDGGGVQNLPVAVARGLGADVILAVDISSPLESKEKLGTFLSIMNQWSSFVTVGNRSQSVELLGPEDVLIVPALGDLSFLSFPRAARAVALGAEAARAKTSELQRYAVGDGAWQAFVERRRRRPDADGRPVIDEVRLVNTSRIGDRVVRPLIRIAPGTRYDGNEVSATVERLAATEWFGLVESRLSREGDRHVLTFRTPERPYSATSLEFGLNLEDDFRGGSTYALIARHQVVGFDRHGSDWTNVLQLGTTGRLATELYRPLGAKRRWFVAPAASLSLRKQPIYVEGRPVGDIEIADADASLAAGHVLGRWGEVRLGLFRNYRLAKLRGGSPDFSEVRRRAAGAAVSFALDSLDTRAFPRRGGRVEATSGYAWTSTGQRNYPHSVRAQAAWSRHRHTVAPALEYERTRGGIFSLDNAAFLGGFQRLSGLSPGELLGAKLALVRLGYYYQLSRLDLGALSQKLYAGFSIERGNTWLDADAPLSWSGLRAGGSIFAGAETFLGPAYIAYGVGEGGRRRIYFSVGGRF